jgi:hypothetical protein
MNFKENQNGDYTGRIEYNDYDLKIVVTEEAFTDRDVLNQNVELARKIAIQKIQNNEFSISQDVFRAKYILITSEDVKRCKSS